MKNTIAIAAALLMLLFSGMRVSGQELLSLPAGGPYKLGHDGFIESLGEFEVLVVTYIPDKVIVYFDGKPLEKGKILSKSQAGELMIFSSGISTKNMIGVTPLYIKEPNKNVRPRIRCINPTFLTKIN